MNYQRSIDSKHCLTIKLMHFDWSPIIFFQHLLWAATIPKDFSIKHVTPTDTLDLFCEEMGALDLYTKGSCRALEFLKPRQSYVLIKMKSWLQAAE